MAFSGSFRVSATKSDQLLAGDLRAAQARMINPEKGSKFCSVAGRPGIVRFGSRIMGCFFGTEEATGWTGGARCRVPMKGQVLQGIGFLGRLFGGQGWPCVPSLSRADFRRLSHDTYFLLVVNGNCHGIFSLQAVPGGKTILRFEYQKRFHWSRVAEKRISPQPCNDLAVGKGT